jgi:hypothetical protein
LNTSERRVVDAGPETRFIRLLRSIED